MIYSDINPFLTLNMSVAMLCNLLSYRVDREALFNKVLYVFTFDLKIALSARS